MTRNLVGKIRVVSLAAIIISLGSVGCDDKETDGSLASDGVDQDLSALRYDDDGHSQEEDQQAESELRQGRRPKIQPKLECVDVLGNGNIKAHWSYRNSSGQKVRRNIGYRNTFNPRPADRGQPTQFLPGTHRDVFTTTFNGKRTLFWVLDGNVASAAQSSLRCKTGGAGSGGGAGKAGVGGAGKGGAGAGGVGGKGGAGGAGAGGAGAGGAGAGGVGGAGGAAGGGGSGVPGGTAACNACRNNKCTNYEQLGFNLVAGCFQKVDPQFGANVNDPAFIQDCISLVSCAYDKKCGFKPATGASECFCGTATLDSCFATAGAANGVCLNEFEAAARSTTLTDISIRVSDLAYPVGWANYVLECDTTLCPNDCPPGAGGASGAGAGGVGGAGAGGAGAGGVGGAGAGGAGAGGVGGAGAGGAGAGGAAGGGGTTVPGGTAACTVCRNTQCTNYQGLGFNTVAGCFEAVDPQFGADATDPTFIQQCVSLMSCAYTKKCGFTSTGSSECFCGTASLDSCFATAGAANGACLNEFETAARSTTLTDISTRVSDLAYPLGWANYLLECDTTLCGSACIPQ